MTSITSFMAGDHRACDALFADVETSVEARQWPQAAAAWRQFERAMRCHLRREEDVLFPAFEEATGMRQGPTAMMRMEHEQMRALFPGLANAIEGQDQRRFLGLSDSLMVLIQQNNMKEEQILYPMCDQRIAAAAPLLQRLEALRPDEG